jgi:hypothetical protein
MRVCMLYACMYMFIIFYTLSTLQYESDVARAQNVQRAHDCRHNRCNAANSNGHASSENCGLSQNESLGTLLKDKGTQCVSKDIAITPPAFLAPEFFARGTPHWTYVGLPPFRRLRLHCTPLRMLCFLCFFIFDRTVLCQRFPVKLR